MLIVSGASGALGSKIVDHLLKLVPAERIAVSLRDSGKAAHLAHLGIRVRQADYDDPASLHHAWEGGESLLLVSSNAAATGGDPLKQHRAAIDAARNVGIGRILYTSQVSCSPQSHFSPGRDHAETERMLAASGLAWTGLRHGFYAASALQMNARNFASGEVAGPQDGKVAWTTHHDLAEADALLLAGKMVIDGPTPPMTGSEAFDLHDLSLMAGDILGKPIGRTITSEDSTAANARAAGVPEGSIAVMLGYYRAASAGEFARIDPFLAKLLDRKPQSMRELMQAALS